MNRLSPFLAHARHFATYLALVVTLFLIAGCAQLESGKQLIDDQSAGESGQQWAGRLALRVEDQPAQSFSASFELKGTAQTGVLKLYSPLGSVLAELQWSPQGAWLRAPGRSDRYDNLQTLVTQANGSPLPVDALFDWLNGKPTKQNGWTVNLDQYTQGRVVALRDKSTTELRIVLDQP